MTTDAQKKAQKKYDKRQREAGVKHRSFRLSEQEYNKVRQFIKVMRQK